MVGYIIGKIRDKTEELEDRNRNEAAKVAAELWDQGLYCICPHLNDYKGFMGHGRYIAWDDYLRGDEAIIGVVDFCIVLPNWKTSKGSIREIEHAQKLGKPIYYWPDKPEIAAYNRPECLLVLISGKQGSGKTATSGLVQEFFNKNTTTKCDVVKFAHHLYKIHDLIFEYMKDYINISYPDKSLLQYIGTDWGRRIDPDIWVKLAHKKIKTMFIESFPHGHIIIMDDTRFPNEVQIPFKNKLTIRLDCNREVRMRRCSAWRKDENHESEVALDTYSKFDLTIDTGSNDLNAVVDSIITAITDRLNEAMEK